MNNNVNPNENLNQNNNVNTGNPSTSNVNNNTVQSNNTVERMTVKSSSVMGEMSTGTVTNNSVNTNSNANSNANATSVSTETVKTEQPVNTNTNTNTSNGNTTKQDERFSLFKTEEKNTTPVIMSKQMADKLESERRKEREEKEKYEFKPVSKFKYFLMIVFFIFMFALIYFLPDITNYINIQKDLKEQENAPAITTGLLTCKLERTTDVFNVNYTAQFSFTDSKLNKLSYVISYEGDSVLDSDKLDELTNKCKLLSAGVSSLAGVNIDCSRTDSTFVETQNFTYSLIDKESINSAYIEAGGVYPEFDNEQDIDMIEKNMSASGYKCERTAS